MWFKYLIVFLVTITCSKFVICARILCVAPTPSYSHQIVYRPIWEALAAKGHDLVVLTTDPWQNSNLTNIKQIDLSFTYKLWRDLNIVKTLANAGINLYKVYTKGMEVFNIIVEEELKHPDVQKLLNDKNEHFDLVIVECVVSTMPAFSNHFNCPYVGILSYDLQSTTHSLLGNPAHPILYPDGLLPYESDINMTFKQRFLNTIGTFFIQMFMWLDGFKGTNLIIQKYFGQDLPPIKDIMKNVSLVLVNTNPILNKRPLGPATVAFGGGVHLQPPRPLSKDLAEFLDGAKNGFIYFSFGTNVNENSITPEMRQIFLNVFKQLPYRVLWKFNIDVPNLPENVKISKWIPQTDILRHKNIKLFITQGGLQSMEEAIFTNVPMVIVPFFADQYTNADRMMKRGVGLVIDKNELNENLLRKTIEEVINNPNYKSKTVEIAELTLDQPIPNIDKAVWWIEYVLRHKGAKHLRNEVAMHLPWYQYYLLDVFAVILAVVAVVFYVIWKTFNFLFKKIVLSNKKLKKN